MISASILGWVIATDDDMVLKGPVRVRLLLDRPLPVEAVVSEIKAPVTTAPIQARVDVPQSLRLASPVAVEVPQLAKPLSAKVDGRVDAAVSGEIQAEVTGDVEAQVDGAVDVQLDKPLKHERVRIGL